MTFITQIIAWLKAIYIKPAATAADPITTEVKTVSEPIVDVAAPVVGIDGVAVVDPVVVVGPTPVVEVAPAVFDVDAFAAKLKSVFALAAPDILAIYDEAVALAKKL